MKKKIMTMLMLLAVSCMIMPTNAKAAKKAYIKTSTGSKATVFVGKTLKLNAKTVGKKKKITYKTSKKSVATVNSKGVIKGKKYGTAKITMKASGVKTKKITVYVRKAATGIKLSSAQTINFYNINDVMYLVDLPGYGYARVTPAEKEKWGKMIENYLHTSHNLKAVFLLIDIRHDPSANDRQMYEWILHNGYEPIIIATKLDKLKRSQVQKNLKAIREGLQLKKGTTVIPYSAETKQGRDEIWELIESLTGGEPSEEA